MLTKNVFTALKKTEILPENPVSETRNHTLDHYANTPMQYTAIFHGCKNDNFQMIF